MKFSTSCKKCDRLHRFLSDVKARYPEYICKPVPPFGDAKARLLIVGLAPGLHGANRSGRPFTGDHAGILLYETLYAAGFSNMPISEHLNDGLKLSNCRITNAVKCLPPENKPKTDEIRNCNAYLIEEIAGLPKNSVILALGKIAHDAVLRATAHKLSAFIFKHGAVHQLTSVTLIDSYHCSRYNTNTRRLTPEMFTSVFEQARAHLKS